MTLDWAVRCVLLIGLPAAVGLLFLSAPLLATLFQYGRFDGHDVVMTSRSLMAFSLGVPAFMLVKTLATGFYSKQNVRMPVKAGAIALAVNMGLNVLFIVPLAHAGLALATSIAAWVNVSLLARYLLRQDVYRFQPGWKKFVSSLLLATSAMTVWLWWASPGLDHWLMWRWPQRVEHLILLIVVAMTIYFILLRLSGVRSRHFLMEQHAN